MPIEKEVSLSQLFLNHWRLSIGIVLATIGLAGLVTTVMPRRYESHMKFLVNNERADLVITPEKSTSAVQRQEITETQVNSEIELLRSRDILENIVLDEKLYQPAEAIAPVKPTRLNIERATIGLQRGLNVSAIRKTNIIEVVYGSKDADQAVAVLRDLGDRYLTAHLAVHTPPGSYNFFGQEVERYSNQLTRSRAALSLFHQNNHLFSITQQQAALVDRFQEVDSKLNDTDAEIREQQTRLAESQTQLAAVPARVVTQIRDVPNQQAAQHLQTMLAELRNKRIDLAVKFKPTDRLIAEVDDQLASTERELAQIQTARATEQVTDNDTLHQSLVAENARTRIALEGLRTRRAELAAMRQGYVQQLDRMDTDNVTLQNLEQHEKEALENYNLYTHRLDEARLADSLDKEKFSNVAMIERPVSSPIPVSPKLSLNLAAGGIMGAFLSLAIAFFLETRTGSPAVPNPSLSDAMFPNRAFGAATGD